MLLFALNSETNGKMQKQFINHDVTKTYVSIVRGYTDDNGIIDYPLKTDSGKLQDAVTHYSTIERFEIPIPLGKFKTSRYSFVEVQPMSGRTHQIRRHFAHISHPIIGDRRHGCNRQNNLFRNEEKLGLETMLLHSSSLTFRHPSTDEVMTVSAEMQGPFQDILDKLRAMTRPDRHMCNYQQQDELSSDKTA